MHGSSSRPSHQPDRPWFFLRKLALLGCALLVALAPTGCASVSDHMSVAPERSGAPPYADDPEANGNPAKAWYN